jgi:hypothetical protein
MLPKRSHCPPSDTLEELWEEIEPILAEHNNPKENRPSVHRPARCLRRDHFPAWGGCQWNRLPKAVPRRFLCASHFPAVGWARILDLIWACLLEECEERKGVDWGACSGAASSATPLSPAHPNTAPRCSLGAQGSACSVPGQRSVTSLVLVCASDLSSDCIQPRPRQSAFFALGCPGRILFRVLFSP